MTAPIPGDPGVVRAGAEAIAASAVDAEDAARMVTGAQQIAAAGWSGAAHGAFDDAAGATGARVGSLVRLAEAAAPLRAYADELERIQGEFAAASVRFEAAHAAVTGPGAGPPSAQVDAARGRLEVESTALEGLRRQAAQANERAAATVAQVARAAQHPAAGELAVLTLTARSTAAMLDATNRSATLLLGAAGAAAGSAGVTVDLHGRTTLPDLDRGMRGLGLDVARAAKIGGFVVVPVLAGVRQAVDDSANPYYSTGERAGRVVAQTASVGGAALAGGAAGATLGSVVPFAGTAVGFLAGTMIGYFAATAVDERNDVFVDWVGGAGDHIADGIRDLGPW